MNKDNIITLPHLSLRQRSQKVGFISEDVMKLIEAMKKATLDWEDNRDHEVGVALAAVQVNKLLRIVVVRNNFDNKSDRTFQVFINPEITKLEGAVIEDFEGCLSIKDIYGKVPRYERVRVKAIKEDGQPVRISAKGFLARVFQHEIDHTNGIVFIDHIVDKPEAFYKLDTEGHLVQLNYEKDISQNSLLW